MKIVLKTIQGKNFDLDVEAEETVKSVKVKLANQQADFPAEQQKLIYQGKILSDEQLVKDTGIKENDTVVVMVAKVKAPSTSTPSTAPAAAPTPAPAPAPTPAAQGGAAPDAAPTSYEAAAATLVSGQAAEATVTQLCDMGFPRDQVIQCLQAAFGNPDRAVEYLMSGIPPSLLAPQAPPAGGGEDAPPAAAPQGGGGGGVAFPAMGAAGGGAGGGAEQLAALEQLRAHPRFAELAAMVAQNPQTLAQILPALEASNPGIVAAIRSNPEAFMRLLQEAVGGDEDDPVEQMLAAAHAAGGGGGAGGAPPGTRTIRLTEEEGAAVERLVQLGFHPQMALEAYLACDKNEELAVNYLLDSGGDMDTSG